MPNPVFKEVGRCSTSDTIDVVLSEVYREEKLVGHTLNKYVTTEAFTGFSKGVFIPDDLTVEVLKLFPKEDLKLALED